MKLNLFIFMLSMLATFSFTSKANAQGTSLSIYPPVIEVQTSPPASPIAPIVIQNNGDDTIELKIELVPIKQSGTSGAIELDPLLMDQGFYSYYRDKVQFLLEGIKVNSLILEPLEAKEIDLNINLRQGDPPGDFYYSIVFISQGNQLQETSNSQLPTGIATNLLLSVGPKSKASGGISDFSTSTFKNSGPVSFTLKLHNSSKHLIAPRGTVEIYNLFGHKVGSIDLLEQYILAGSDRHLVDETQSTPSARLSYVSKTPQVIWPEKFLLGFYSAEANILLEDNGISLNSKTYFFAFPIYLFFPLAIAIFIALSIYLRVKKKI